MTTTPITLIADPSISLHSTGGAFDIYLIDAESQHLDMGIHPADWMGYQGILALVLW